GCSLPQRYLHCFPTRRSSDLENPRARARAARGSSSSTSSSALDENDPGGSWRDRAAGGDDAMGIDGTEPRRTHRTPPTPSAGPRSEEHTSELQSRGHLVCRLM